MVPYYIGGGRAGGNGRILLCARDGNRFQLLFRGNRAVTGGMNTEGETPKNSASFEMFSRLTPRRPANTALIVVREMPVAAATSAWLTPFDSIR
jgi:hypothetical protein